MFLWLQSIDSSSISKSTQTGSVNLFHKIAFKNLSSVIIRFSGLSALWVYSLHLYQLYYSFM